MPDAQLFLSLAVFAATMTGTPGPNNMMLTASGANFGYNRTLPHLLGVTVGVASLITLVAAGLGVLFNLFPRMQDLLKVVASVYLAYLAWRIATAPPPGGSATEKVEERSPMTFTQALLFQYVNPKAWAMAVTAVGSFTITGNGYWLSALIVVAIFMLVGFPLTSLWAAFGALMGRVISSASGWVRFNRCMGLLTLSCLLFIW